MEIARRRGIPIVVDPKYRQFFEYAGATVFKPNRRELESALGAAVDLQNGNALPEVLARLKVDNLLVTLGAEGMVLVMKDGSLTHIPSIARDDLRRLRRRRHGHGLDGLGAGGRGLGARGGAARELRGGGGGGQGRRGDGVARGGARGARGAVRSDRPAAARRADLRSC